MTQDVAAARVDLERLANEVLEAAADYEIVKQTTVPGRERNSIRFKDAEGNVARARNAFILAASPTTVLSLLAMVAALEEGMPTEAMLSAARGLIMARDLGAPNHVTTLGDVARSGYYGSEWAHILTDEERAMTGPLTKAHFAQLIWRAMSSARDRANPQDESGRE